MKEVDPGAVLDAFRKNERTQEGLPDILCRVRRPRACPGVDPGMVETVVEVHEGFMR